MGDVTVHVVGDNGALWTVVGTLGGVIVGLVGAWLRQRSQIKAEHDRLTIRLTAEDGRLKKQLAAEKARLTEQLGHDQEVREREALRDVLDAALEAARKQHIAMGAMILKHEFGQEAPVSSVGHAGSRLLIRLGREHPVTQSYSSLRDALRKVGDEIERARGTETTAQREKRCRTKHEQAMAALRTFSDTAVALVGTPTAKRSAKSSRSGKN
ncbi:MAG TPA: hypothetical protein VLJ80_11450 [Solirubrobacteraceae bacterium]|nr:hypothetical protein [Solirubrobacteraceae bacterium]